jgi:ATP-dependent DNA helicase RecG
LSEQILKTPIAYLKGVGPQRAEILKKEISIFTYGDLLTNYPFRYIDRTRFYKINEVNGELPLIQILVRLKSFEIIGEKQGRRLVAQAKDETGEIELVWFQGIKWIEKNIKLNHVYIIFGKVTFFNNKVQMAHPEMELFSKENQSRGNLSLQPVYSSTEKLKQFSLDSKGIQKIVSPLLDLVINDVEEVLPDYLIKKYKLYSRKEALFYIHFPQDAITLQKAQATLKFQELFFIQLRLLRSKLIRSKKFKGNLFTTVLL